jgi:hypothetical protein
LVEYLEILDELPDVSLENADIHPDKPVQRVIACR